MIGRFGLPIFQILRGLEGAYNVALMKAVPTLEGMRRDFLYYYLQLPVLLQFVEMNSDRTAGQDGVNKAHLLQFRCLIRPPPEQQQIVEKIKVSLKRIDRLEAEAARSRKLLDRLESAIFAKAFRGELVSQNPTDEPATTLLTRIQSHRPTTPTPKHGRGAKINNLARR